MNVGKKAQGRTGYNSSGKKAINRGRVGSKGSCNRFEKAIETKTRRQGKQVIKEYLQEIK